MLNLQIDLQTAHSINAVATSGGGLAQQYYVTQAKFSFSDVSPFTLDTIPDADGNEQVYIYMYS